MFGWYSTPNRVDELSTILTITDTNSPSTLARLVLDDNVVSSMYIWDESTCVSGSSSQFFKLDTRIKTLEQQALGEFQSLKYLNISFNKEILLKTRFVGIFPPEN